jgi:hypothetical protein
MAVLRDCGRHLAYFIWIRRIGANAQGANGMRCELIGLAAGALAAFAAPAHARKAWTSADNVVTVAVPKGWETLRDTGYDFFSEA